MRRSQPRKAREPACQFQQWIPTVVSTATVLGRPLGRATPSAAPLGTWVSAEHPMVTAFGARPESRQSSSGFSTTRSGQLRSQLAAVGPDLVVRVSPVLGDAASQRVGPQWRQAARSAESLVRFGQPLVAGLLLGHPSGDVPCGWLGELLRTGVCGGRPALTARATGGRLSWHPKPGDELGKGFQWEPEMD